jgi:hypothetical protein
LAPSSRVTLLRRSRGSKLEGMVDQMSARSPLYCELALYRPGDDQRSRQCLVKCHVLDLVHVPH